MPLMLYEQNAKNRPTNAFLYSIWSSLAQQVICVTLKAKFLRYALYV